MIVIPLSSQLYNAKKASADGRKLIWKLSAQMIPEKPLTGYGYGFFEKEYNLHQANYIKIGKASPEELINAVQLSCRITNCFKMLLKAVLQACY